jgi:hypothetical protein
MCVAFDSFIHTIVLDKIMIVSGVDYIKEVLFSGMAAGGDTAIMTTEEEVVEFVEWDNKPYQRQGDDIVLVTTNGNSSQLWEDTLRERNILHAAVVKTGYMRFDIKRALVDPNTKEYSPPKSAKFQLAQKKAVDNQASFRGLRDERNRWITALFRNKKAIEEFESEHYLQFDKFKHVRRVFVESLVATRGDELNIRNVYRAIQERNALLADFPIAIKKRNELVPAFNEKHAGDGGHTRTLLDTTTRHKRYPDTLIDLPKFVLNGGVLYVIKNFRLLITERDDLYIELQGISDEIKEMGGEYLAEEPAAAALTAPAAKASGEGVTTSSPPVPTLAGGEWNKMIAPSDEDKADAVAKNASVGTDGAISESDDKDATATGSATEASKPSLFGRAAAKAKALVGYGSAKSPVDAKAGTSGAPPAASNSTVQVSTATGGDPVAQSADTVVTVPSYTTGTLSGDRGVGPNSARTDMPAASGRGGAQAIITEYVDATPQAALQVVVQPHTGRSGGGVSDDEFKDVADGPALAQLKAELKQTKDELANSEAVIVKNRAWFDKIGVHVGKTDGVTIESLVLKLVAFETNVRGLVEGDIILTQDEMVGEIQARFAEKPALIAAIRHEIFKSDPVKDGIFQDNVVEAVANYVTESADVRGLLTQGSEPVIDHDELMKRIRAKHDAFLAMAHDYQENMAELHGISRALDDTKGNKSAEIAAYITTTKKLINDMCVVMGDKKGKKCDETELLDNIQQSKTKYTDFARQIAVEIPLEIEKDGAGKFLSVLERAHVWSQLTIAIKQAADVTSVTAVVATVKGYKEDIQRLIGGPSTGAALGGVDSGIAHAAEAVRIYKERGDHLETQFIQAQDLLHAAQVAKLEAETLQLASDAKLAPLELQLALLRDELLT